MTAGAEAGRTSRTSTETTIGEYGLGEPGVADPHSSITRVEEGFLINGRKFSELETESMSIEELDEVVARIGSYQREEYQSYVDDWGVENLRTISEEDYHLRRLWLFPELMLFPVRRDGKLTGEYVVLEEGDSPTLYGLREMLRAVRAMGGYASREHSRYQEWVSRAEGACPQATLVESPDRSTAYFFNPDGSICSGFKVSGL